jgi:hypothetical protein
MKCKLCPIAFSGSSFWSSLTGLVGQKQLDRATIEPVIAKMQDHLISKNVASDVAGKLCDSVASNLEGKVLGEFEVSSLGYFYQTTLKKSASSLNNLRRNVFVYPPYGSRLIDRVPHETVDAQAPRGHHPRRHGGQKEQTALRDDLLWR